MPLSENVYFFLAAGQKNDMLENMLRYNRIILCKPDTNSMNQTCI